MADQIRRLEELALNGLPALESETIDGWVLRAAAGYTGRANSAAPLYPGRRPLDSKLGHLEDWYRQRGLVPRLRLTPAAEPSGLDEALDRRGYLRTPGAVSVQSRPLDGNDAADQAVELREGSVPVEWMNTLAGFQSRVASNRQTVQRLFSLLPPRSAFAMIRRDAEPVAIGRAVFETGHVGIFDVFTREDVRNQGLATDITLALLGWGARNYATRAYLQVLADSPGHRLYDRLGFREVYRYWYRQAPRG